VSSDELLTELGCNYADRENLSENMSDFFAKGVELSVNAGTDEYGENVYRVVRLDGDPRNIIAPLEAQQVAGAEVVKGKDSSPAKARGH
jgi:hypothetical protein